MSTARLFIHKGCQALLLPKAFRFEGSEVIIEKRGGEVVLKPKSGRKMKTLRDLARYMRKHHPEGANFPDVERPKQ